MKPLVGRELTMLLNLAPGNEKYRIRNTAYAVMKNLGLLAALSGLVVPIVYAAKKKTMSKEASAATVSLLVVGTTVQSIFLGLQQHNRRKAIDNYNTYVVGLKRKF